MVIVPIYQVAKCDLCGKSVNFKERHFFENPKTGKPLHWHCANRLKGERNGMEKS